MKKVFKHSVVFILAFLLLFGLQVSSFAESPSITFLGDSDGFSFQPGSEYTATDLFGNFKGVMPGDVLTETITFTNAATDCNFVNLYMKAVAHDETENPLSETVAETETVVTMTDFLSQLRMEVWNGAELIYEDSPDQTDGLSSYKLLGRFDTGDTATLTVKLTVPETLGNEYANRAGEVDWVFYVDAYNASRRSVRKVWADGNENHAQDSVTVNLLKDDKVERTAVLNADNGWAYTFSRLEEGYTWSIREANVPSGYTVQYDYEGTTTVIINTPKGSGGFDPDEPLDLSVKKVWSNDDSSQRPSFVTVSLYDGEKLYDTVTLNADNNWTYSWKDVDALGNWQVVETNIPLGYTPSYRVSGNTVTITNTRELIQTGQLNLHIVLLGGAGLILVSSGGWILLKKRKSRDA